MADFRPLRTGFIGLGRQGGPMAERILAAGYPLTVWARRADVLVPFVEGGAIAAPSVPALARTSEYVAICVVDDAGVREVCDELIPNLSRGSQLVIHSTILPETCEDLSARCAANGIGFLDAPVSGGGGAAAAGTLTVMCGGTPRDFTRARPVLETFAGKLFHLGPAGAAQRAKIVNNALMAANMGLAQAALDAGQNLDIDRASLAELIKASSGRSFGFEVLSRLPGPDAFAHGAPLLVKDVALLSAILPGHDGAALLAQAAGGFLAEATGRND